MTLLNDLAKLVQHGERAVGACSLAQHAGATHLCIFIRDPELAKFLPGLGFPQKLPSGIEWADYLRHVASSSSPSVKRQLPSPFFSSRVTAVAVLLNEDAIVVFLGNEIHADAYEKVVLGLHIIAALLIQEVRTNIFKIHADLSHKTVLESRQLAASLSAAHDTLAEALDARESLLKKIRKQDGRLRLVRRIAGIGTWEFNAAAGEAQFSAETSAIYGLPLEERRVSLDTILSRIHEEDRERVRKQLEAAFSNNGDYSIQFRVVWPDGVVRWVEDRGTALSETDGSATTLIGFSLDITQRVMTEETLIRTEKLAAAGRLAASIAHEINNPLESLINLIYIAKGKSESGEVRELLTLADQELIRLAAVTRQSLGFYRDVSTSLRFDVRQTIEQVIELFDKQIREAQIQLAPEFPAENCEVEGWPGEIKQAISNLLINAIHASEPSVSLRVRVHNIGNNIYIAIADRGHGISREHQLRIFEPFFSTKQGSGTGLGLWVTKQIIEKHGGSIRVRSNPTAECHGTTVLVCLPRAGEDTFFSGSEKHLRYRSLESGTQQ
ncbi:MAG TPA: ATP-binding protein [Acidobacteriaceae bacterium]|nr:ATP-binding protein [Acidobacteriaceae bacterium]